MHVEFWTLIIISVILNRRIDLRKKIDFKPGKVVTGYVFFLNKDMKHRFVSKGAD